MHTKPNIDGLGSVRRLLLASALVAALAACSSSPSAERSDTAAASQSTDSGSVSSESSESGSATASEVASDAGTYSRVELPGLNEVDLDPIANDDTVTTGTLANGLRYFVQNNDDPGQSAELRLVIDAGSVDQQGPSGVAHFVEHMMFNGTEEYPKNELLNVLRGFGTSFGADVNAYTSFDETVYMLKVSNDADALSTGMGIMEQWLSHATIDPAEVDAERGVIVDEWRNATQGPMFGMFDASLGLYYADNPYAKADPIGTKTDIETASADDIRAYYEQWYRPSNASVVVVGDIDVDATVAQIEDLFGPATASPTPEPERPDTSLDGHFSAETKPGYALAEGPDELWSTIDIGLPLVGTSIDDPESDLASTYDGLIYDMLVRRLKTDIDGGNAPFDQVEVSGVAINPGLDTRSLSARTDADGATATMQALLDEYERAARFGFDDAELAVVRQAAQADLDSLNDGANTTQDAEYADRLVSHVVYGAPYPSIADEYQYRHDLLDQASTDALHQRFLARWTNTAPYLVINTKSDIVDSMPTETDFTAAVSALGERTLDRRGATAETESGDATDSGRTGDKAAQQLMLAPEPVEPTNQEAVEVGQEIDNFDPVELTYPNGVRVIINPSTIAEGQVTLSASSPGGRSVLDPSQTTSALVAPEIVAGSGVGDLDRTELADLLSSVDVNLFGYIDTYEESLGGTFATRDADTALAYVHQLMTSARVDESALQDVVGTYEGIAGLQEVAVVNELIKIRYDDEVHAVIPSPAGLATLTTDDVAAVWNDRFSNAADWVFVFSGDVNLDDFVPLSNTYLGTLPSDGPDRPIVDVTRDMPSGVNADTVNAGSGDKAVVYVAFEAPVTVDAKTAVIAQVAQNVLDARVLAVAREELGETYSPRSLIDVVNDPDPVAQSFVTATGAPEDMEHLQSVIVEQVGELGSTGPTVDEFDEAVAQVRESFKFYDDFQFAAALEKSARYPDRGLEVFVDQPAALDQVTADDVKAYFASELPSDNYFAVTGMPATSD